MLSVIKRIILLTPKRNCDAQFSHSELVDGQRRILRPSPRAVDGQQQQIDARGTDIGIAIPTPWIEPPTRLALRSALGISVNAEPFFALDASIVVAMRAKSMKRGTFGCGAVVARTVIAAIARPRLVVALSGTRTVIGTDPFGTAEPSHFEVGGRAILAGFARVSFVAETRSRSSIADAVLWAATVVSFIVIMVIVIVVEGTYHLGTGEKSVLSYSIAQQDRCCVAVIHSSALRGGRILDILYETLFVGYERLVFVFASLDAVGVNGGGEKEK
mmetsp:Transcript_34672/g.73075  ORF Transcript_34672/g.73075 Transcript_34672/m.73075 type:complete len:273 (-) Transcript_34672:78-896(-)